MKLINLARRALDKFEEKAEEWYPEIKDQEEVSSNPSDILEKQIKEHNDNNQTVNSDSKKETESSKSRSFFSSLVENWDEVSITKNDDNNMVFTYRGVSFIKKIDVEVTKPDAINVVTRAVKEKIMGK